MHTQKDHQDEWFQIPFNGNEVIKFLEYLGFQITRTKGSHLRLISEDGKATSVPMIREDLKTNFEEFTNLYSKYRGNNKIFFEESCA
jgi:predicted RNA binding protein YcfA (HicA-like mRNA interferase family)